MAYRRYTLRTALELQSTLVDFARMMGYRLEADRTEANGIRLMVISQGPVKLLFATTTGGWGNWAGAQSGLLPGPNALLYSLPTGQTADFNLAAAARNFKAYIGDPGYTPNSPLSFLKIPGDSDFEIRLFGYRTCSTIHAQIEYSPGSWALFSFGQLARYTTDASTQTPAPYAVGGFTTALQARPYLPFIRQGVLGAGAGHVRVYNSFAQAASADTDEASAQALNQSDLRLCAGGNPELGAYQAVLAPIHVAYKQYGLPKLEPLGMWPNCRIVTIAPFEPGDLYRLGHDTWMMFPEYNKALQAGSRGVAILKQD